MFIYIFFIKSKGKQSNQFFFPKGKLFNYANLSVMIGYDSGLEISINRGNMA